MLAAAAPSLAQAPVPAPVQTQPATVEAQPPAQEKPAADDGARPAATAGRIQRDLSPWSMFLAADAIVKAVIISLGLASLLTWTIFLAKSVQLLHAGRRLRGALEQIADARTLSEARMILGPVRTVLSALLAAAMQEIKLSGESGADEGIKERVASRFAEISRAEGRAMRQGLAILGTIGATSPFVGLFGTVWGIMNSFIGISRLQTTNLAVVAPGIAEALLATAVGLVAAIPAVMIYNYFSRATKGYLELVGRGSGAVGRLLSRDLDRVRGRLAAHAAE